MHLRILPNPSRWKAHLGTVEVAAGTTERVPFPIDAIVFEEDTYLVLNASRTLFAPGEHPIRTLTSAFLAKPAKPGTVITRGGHPLRFLAVIHDLDRNPSWREEWIRETLRMILSEAGERGLRSLALPLLGTVHGTFSAVRFVRHLRSSLEGSPPSNLSRIWLLAPVPIVANAVERTSPPSPSP